MKITFMFYETIQTSRRLSVFKYMTSNLLGAEHPERTSPSRSERVVVRSGLACLSNRCCLSTGFPNSLHLFAFYFGGTWMFRPAEGLVVTSLTDQLVNVGINRWALIIFITKCSRCWSASTLFAFSFSSRCNFYFFYLNVFLVTKVSFKFRVGGKTLFPW